MALGGCEKAFRHASKRWLLPAAFTRFTDSESYHRRMVSEARICMARDAIAEAGVSSIESPSS